MNLQRIIRVLVAILRIHALGERRQRVGQLSVGFHFSALLGGEFSFTGDVFEHFINVYRTGTMIEQRTAGI